jgi:RNA-binding protein
MPGPRDVKVLKFSKRGGQRPEVKTLARAGQPASDAGGQIKRAKKHAGQHQKAQPGLSHLTPQVSLCDTL